MTTRSTKTSAKKAPAKRAASTRTRRTTKAAGPVKKTAAKRPAKKTAAKAPAKKTTTRKAAAAKASPASRRRGRKPKPDPRLLEVLKLRRDGKSYADIATALKYSSPDLAFRAFEQAMQMLEVTSIANTRLLELERLNQLQSALWPQASEGDPKALDLLLKVLDQKLSIPQPLDNRPDRQLGPVEAATAKETAKLASHAPALAAAVLVLARSVDDNASDPAAAANASRELRISMTQLRGLAGTRVEGDKDPDTPQPRKKTAGEVVVPASRLEELRREADSGPGPT